MSLKLSAWHPARAVRPPVAVGCVACASAGVGYFVGTTRQRAMQLHKDFLASYWVAEEIRKRCSSSEDPKLLLWSENIHPKIALAMLMYKAYILTSSPVMDIFPQRMKALTVIADNAWHYRMSALAVALENMDLEPQVEMLKQFMKEGDGAMETQVAQVPLLYACINIPKPSEPMLIDLQSIGRMVAGPHT